MKLRESKGNMYDFVTHTGNVIKGECHHNCSYCYMKRWGKLNTVRFDEKELKIPMTNNDYIFVGSSCDMFADNIPDEWILKVLRHCDDYNNQYLFQTKNPSRILEFGHQVFYRSVICTTIETNRQYYDIMNNSPIMIDRVTAMKKISKTRPTFVTIVARGGR